MKTGQTGASATISPVSSAYGRVFVAFLFAVVIIAFFYLDADRYLTLEALRANRDLLLAYTQVHYLSAVLLFIFLYCLQTTFSLPGAALFTLAGGLLFGSLAGTLYVNLGATSGAILAFLASRYLLSNWVETKFGHRLVSIQEGFSKNAFHYLLTLRLIPIFPFFLVNLVSGLTRISLGQFMAATAIGIIPGSFVYAYAGRQLGTINSLQEIASPKVLLAFALLGLLALVPVGYRTLTARRETGNPGGRQKTTYADVSDTTHRDREPVTVLPDDEHNRTLVHNVHPPDWVNPEPTGPYNLVVIGAGTAGLVTAAVAAALGAKVALIEKHLMGGDCLNVGCVPSKGVIRAARAWQSVRETHEFGLKIPDGILYDFAAVMARMRKLRAQISRLDSAHRYTKMGVDVFIGEGRFTDHDTAEVDGKKLRFSKAAVCTGARAAAPPIPGLEEAGYLTNETVFTLTQLPGRMAVIGGGPIGCELAQAFARFGSRVYLVEEVLHGILPKEDRDAAEIVRESMHRDGVQLLCCGKELTISKTDGGKRLTVDSHGQHYDITVDEILVGVGRAPNVEGLCLEQAGVEYNAKRGVKVNSRLQTTNPRIYAAGDICFPFKFTHTADALAQIVIQNVLFPHPFGLGYACTDDLIIPWCTYTSPEIAHVGLYESDAAVKGIEVETFTYRLDEVDRAILDGEQEGFARVHVRKGTGRIVGATIVAAHAGDLISEITLAMKAGAGLRTISSTIHPYPTQAEVIKKVATAWRKTTLTEGKKRILRTWFEWTRP